MFIYFWERECEQGRGRERETQNPKEAPGLDPRAGRPWPELKSDTQPTEPPGGPYAWFLKEATRPPSLTRELF